MLRKILSTFTLWAVLIGSSASVLAGEAGTVSDPLTDNQAAQQLEQPAETVNAVTETAAQNTAEAAETAETEAALTVAAGTAVTEAATEKSVNKDTTAGTWYGIPQGAGEQVMRGRRNFSWPVPSSVSLSSCFIDPMGHGSTHYAIDIVADYGAPVTASYEGTVVATLYNGNGDNGYGNSVVVLHEDVPMADGSTMDLYTRYSHMSSITVSPGDTVTAGTQVGTIGGTGSGYEPYSPHLDFQILTCSDAEKDNWSVPSRYSVDPFRNELLEVPSGFTASGGADAWCGCCYDYVAYVRSLYAGKAQ